MIINGFYKIKLILYLNCKNLRKTGLSMAWTVDIDVYKRQDTHEVKAAVLAVKENTKLPVFVTMTFDENAKLLTGGDIPAAVALLEGLGVDGIGFNCGLGPTQMKAFMKELTACCSTPIIVNPNAGLPKNVN